MSTITIENIFESIPLVLTLFIILCNVDTIFRLSEDNYFDEGKGPKEDIFDSFEEKPK